MPIDPLENESTKLEFWMLKIANLKHSYNPQHQIIRVEFNNGFYDIKCAPGYYVPNAQDHLVVAMLPEGFFDDQEPIPSRQEDLPPGLLSKDGHLDDVPEGMSWIVPKRQTVTTTAPQNGNAGFAMSDTNMFDSSNVTVAVSPHLPTRDYTTLEDGSESDPEYQSVGLFVNKQGTVLLKSTGGSITIGKEGVHIGGKLMTTSSNKDTGVMTENPLSKLLGSTIPTAGASWPTIPNIGTVVSIANAAQKFTQIVDASKNISQIVSNLG